MCDVVALFINVFIVFRADIELVNVFAGWHFFGAGRNDAAIFAGFHFFLGETDIVFD